MSRARNTSTSMSSAPSTQAYALLGPPRASSTDHCEIHHTAMTIEAPEQWEGVANTGSGIPLRLLWEGVSDTTSATVALTLLLAALGPELKSGRMQSQLPTRERRPPIEARSLVAQVRQPCQNPLRQPWRRLRLLRGTVMAALVARRIGILDFPIHFVLRITASDSWRMTCWRATT